MRVAAYQAPFAACAALDRIVPLLREQVGQCETMGVDVLCCPEGALGGLADYVPDPARVAIDAGALDEVLAPLASDAVTTIVGFTERGPAGRLYNSAAVYHRGAVLGVYRKRHPAIRRSVYAAGDEAPVFAVGGATFGVVICRDSTFEEPARELAAGGATILFVPTNNGLPPAVGGAGVVAEARRADIALAIEHGLWVVRADVAGRHGGLAAHGSSGIVDPNGTVVAAARPLRPDLVVADVGPPGDPRRVDVAR